MKHENPARWPYLALAGIGLAAIPLAAVAAKRRRHDIDPDSAPGYTARRSFGEYKVVGRSVTIAKPRAELFAFWRDFRNLPRFMANLERIEPSGGEPGHATWHIKAANGKTYAVDTRIAREVDGELIAWRFSNRASLVKPASLSLSGSWFSPRSARAAATSGPVGKARVLQGPQRADITRHAHGP